MTTATPDRIDLPADVAQLLADASRLMGEALDRPHAARVAPVPVEAVTRLEVALVTAVVHRVGLGLGDGVRDER